MMKFKTILNEKLEEWILAGSLLLMTLLVIGQVVTRFVINIPMSWSVELSRYIFIWIAWISVSYAVQKNSHIRVEFLKDKLSSGGKKILDLFVLIIFFVFALFLLIVGTQFITSMQSSQVSPSLGIPMWTVYLVIPIAGLLISIRLIQQFVLILRQ